MSAPAGLANLRGAAWFEAAPVRRVFALLDRDGEEVRIVGGAVRNALMERPPGDIDFATTATPDTVVARAEAEGIRVVPVGIDHGTVALVIEGRSFEVTTLREDIETDGRHAVVRFGRNWKADAKRRDFTVNALSVDAAGRVHDPVGGAPDIQARRIRFIGDADRRIAEDRLRILRFFRFHAEYGEGAPDAAGLSASIRARRGIPLLSAERIGQEMRRLVMAPRASATAQVMQDAGILPVVLAGVGAAATLRRLVEAEGAAGLSASAALRLAALACRIEEDAERVTARLRLSNAERDRMTAAIVAARSFTALLAGAAARRAIYAGGAPAFRDALLLAEAWSRAAGTDWAALHAVAARWSPPRFPLTGHDVIGAGIVGRGVGEALRAVEAWWIAEDFRPDEAALRHRLQQVVAAHQ